MSIFNWFNKMLGIDNSKINIDLPSEFQLPTEHIDDRTPNFEHNDFIDFDENMNIFNLSFENMLRQLQSEFESFNENNISSNIFIDQFNADGSISNQPLMNNDEYNCIPKNNYLARNYFLNPWQTPKPLDKLPVRVTTMSPGFNFGQSSSRSYISGKWNGRMIEKEISTRQLQDGITEKVIVLKDGNQKCITTITENSKTGNQNCNKQLINLDESQLNEFENRFTKFR